MSDNKLPIGAYVFDVFMSYKRSHPSGTWVRERLYKDFTGYLGEELGRDARVFFDQRDIQAGEHWVTKLDWALNVSKVLVAVCSARYFFDSEYCRKEWYSFGELEVDGKILIGRGFQFVITTETPFRSKLVRYSSLIFRNVTISSRLSIRTMLGLLTTRRTSGLLLKPSRLR